MNKYRNKKVLIDGRWFDSIKEGETYLKLKMMQQGGAILDFICQPELPFMLNGKLMFRYYPDFEVIWTRQRVEYWDVKSPITKKNPVYRLKKKIIEEQYKIKIIEL